MIRICWYWASIKETWYSQPSLTEITKILFFLYFQFFIILLFLFSSTWWSFEKLHLLKISISSFFLRSKETRVVSIPFLINFNCHWWIFLGSVALFRQMFFDSRLGFVINPYMVTIKTLQNIVLCQFSLAPVMICEIIFAVVNLTDVIGWHRFIFTWFLVPMSWKKSFSFHSKLKNLSRKFYPV